MTVKITYKNVEVLCESVDVAVAICRKLFESNMPAAPPSIPCAWVAPVTPVVPVTPIDPIAPVVQREYTWSSRTVAHYFKQLKPPARRVLVALCGAHPQALSSQELMRRTGVKRLQGFGPLMAAIDRRARYYDLPNPVIAPLGGPGYTIHPGFRNLLVVHPEYGNVTGELLE